MSLRYELIPPREALPLCDAHFRCGSRYLAWHEDEDDFRAAWPFLKKLGYSIENEYGELAEAEVLGDA